MPPQSGFPTSETLPPSVRVHVLGAGPVGLAVAALLQSNNRFSVHLYEKRRDYSRTRMVQLAPYLVADSVESYRDDYIDGESIEAIFEPSEVTRGLAFRQEIPSDLITLLRGWTQGFCPLNVIERSLSELIDSRATQPVLRTAAAVTADEAMAMLQPGDVLIDCTGTKSLLRDSMVPGDGAADAEANTFRLRLEHALVVTFLYGEPYDCNEYCKYYKNIENAYYKFIPAVNRTYWDGHITHVTGIVNIPAEDYERMPSRFDGEWLRGNFPQVAQSMDRFIAKINTETDGAIIGDLEIVRIPLDLYRARNATNVIAVSFARNMGSRGSACFSARLTARASASRASCNLLATRSPSPRLPQEFGPLATPASAVECGRSQSLSSRAFRWIRASRRYCQIVKRLSSSTRRRSAHVEDRALHPAGLQSPVAADFRLAREVPRGMAMRRQTAEGRGCMNPEQSVVDSALSMSTGKGEPTSMTYLSALSSSRMVAADDRADNRTARSTHLAMPPVRPAGRTLTRRAHDPIVR